MHLARFLISTLVKSRSIFYYYYLNKVINLSNIYSSRFYSIYDNFQEIVLLKEKFNNHSNHSALSSFIKSVISKKKPSFILKINQ